MVWPTDNVTKTHLDAGTDSPSNARAEIEAAIDHLKAISAEVTDGATVWHSGNHGPTSGLDADKLDGEDGSFYRNASNINSGSIPLAHIPATLTGKDADTLDGQHGSFYQNAGNLNDGIIPLARLYGITATELATGSVGQDEIGAGAVHQGELDTGQGEVSTASVTGADLTLPGGEYGFYPNVRASSGEYVLSRISNGFSSTSYACNIFLDPLNETGTAYANQRYINASPPHKIENLDYKEFIFALLDNSGDIVSAWIATDPPWYHNGPTKTTPNVKRGKGKKYRRDRAVPTDLLAIKYSDPGKYYKELAKLPFIEYEITQEIKNADMPLIPHPFASARTGESVVIIEPNQSGVYMQVCDLFNQGESICEMLHNGYLKIDNTEIPTNARPPGMPMHRIKWKNTGR